ncbi:MAG: hypothetical protein P8Y37_05925 [Anaerolineales bacterium]
MQTRTGSSISELSRNNMAELVTNRRQRRDILLLGLIALLSCGGFLFACQRAVGLGFPLDDAWIHQTFARNLASGQGWSFQSGQPSGGSTGPAWGLLLSLVYFGNINPVWGTYLLGFGLLWGSSVLGYLIVREILPGNPIAPLITGAVIGVEWHLVWAALSGMETLFLGLIIFMVLYWLIRRKSNFWYPGFLIGFSVWVRPDGLTLMGPVLLVAILESKTIKEVFNKTCQVLIGVAALAAPYFLFNWFVAGDIWPNTFFAKQAEYQSLQKISFLTRYARMALPAITGLGALLMPGFIYEGFRAIKSKDWARVGMLVWVVGYVGLYAWKLPVAYQHGRYLMPVMPMYFVLGCLGLQRLLVPGSEKTWFRVVSRSVLGAGLVTVGSFWFLGMRAFARDVGVIQTEMVETARWINANTSEDAVIGAHDIGALGYYGNRKILDLAGLVSPDVIPFIRDEERLARFLSGNSADYLVTFPSWYPDLVEDLKMIYQSQGEFAPGFGMDHMTVYFWQ